MWSNAVLSVAPHAAWHLPQNWLHHLQHDSGSILSSRGYQSILHDSIAKCRTSCGQCRSGPQSRLPRCKAGCIMCPSPRPYKSCTCCGRLTSQSRFACTPSAKSCKERKEYLTFTPLILMRSLAREDRELWHQLKAWRCSQPVTVVHFQKSQLPELDQAAWQAAQAGAATQSEHLQGLQAAQAGWQSAHAGTLTEVQAGQGCQGADICREGA